MRKIIVLCCVVYSTLVQWYDMHVWAVLTLVFIGLVLGFLFLFISLVCFLIFVACFVCCCFLWLVQHIWKCQVGRKNFNSVNVNPSLPSAFFIPSRFLRFHSFPSTSLLFLFFLPCLQWVGSGYGHTACFCSRSAMLLSCGWQYRPKCVKTWWWCWWL